MRFAELRRLTITAYLDTDTHQWLSTHDAAEALEEFECGVIDDIDPDGFVASAAEDMLDWPTCQSGRFARGWISSSEERTWIVRNAIGHLISAVVGEIHERAQTAHGRIALRAEVLRIEEVAP